MFLLLGITFLSDRPAVNIYILCIFVVEVNRQGFGDDLFIRDSKLGYIQD